MVFDKREENYNASELGHWNVASEYARTKIMKPLEYSDHYQNIARFGYDTLIEQLDNFGIPVDTLKLIGFERLVDELIKLCGNVKFAMKVAGTKKILEAKEKQLIQMRTALPKLFKTITKQKNRVVTLNEEKYYKALNMVIKIKSELNEPLNKNHLIFTDKPEFDLKAYKKQIKEDAQSRG